MNSRKFHLLCFGSILVLSLLLSDTVSAKNWENLSAIQKRVLQQYQSQWNGYSKSKQQGLLKKSSKEINGIKLFKKWFNKTLTASERKTFLKNKKEMTEKEFTKYVDELMKEYGKPKK